VATSETIYADSFRYKTRYLLSCVWASVTDMKPRVSQAQLVREDQDRRYEKLVRKYRGIRERVRKRSIKILIWFGTLGANYRHTSGVVGD
jgi:hypothetical protein